MFRSAKAGGPTKHRIRIVIILSIQAFFKLLSRRGYHRIPFQPLLMQEQNAGPEASSITAMPVVMPKLVATANRGRAYSLFLS